MICFVVYVCRFRNADYRFFEQQPSFHLVLLPPYPRMDNGWRMVVSVPRHRRRQRSTRALVAVRVYSYCTVLW